MQFKIGDRVKATGEGIRKELKGERGTIHSIDPDKVWVKFDTEVANPDDHDGAYFFRNENLHKLTVVGHELDDNEIARLFGVTPTVIIHLEADLAEKLQEAVDASEGILPVSVESLVHMAVEAFLDGLYPKEEEE